MHAQATQLKPLSGVTLSADESKILAWIRSAKWEAQPATREPIPFKAKVPEFFSGVRLYGMQGGGGSQSALELLIKKLQYQGVITPQNMHPLEGHGAARFLTFTKADLDNLGVGRKDAEDEDE